MARWAEKLIERAALGLLVSSGIAAYLGTLAIAVPFGTVALLLMASWAAAMLLLALPYGLRFGEGPRRALSVGLALAAMFALPILPYTALDRPLPDGAGLFFFVTLATMVKIGFLLAWGFRNQGRHFYTERELPELEGETRAAAEAVIRRAGLRPVSLRVMPLGGLNAFVLGLKNCVVALDPSVGKLLPREEIEALVAHEAGHVRAGGMLAGLAPVPLTLMGANTAALLGWISEVDIFACVGAFLFLRDLTSQLLEIHCDRFAAGLTSPATAASMLRKVHESEPRALERLLSRRILVPFLSHPPLEVRLAAIGQGDRRSLRVYLGTWLIFLTFFFVGPAAFLAGSRIGGVELPDVVTASVRFLPASFFACAILAAVLVHRRMRGFLGEDLGEVARGRWLRRLTRVLGFLLIGLLIAVLLLVWLQSDLMNGFLDALLIFAALFAALFFACVVIGFLSGVFREGVLRLPARVRKAILECGAVLQDGKPDEALAIMDRALERAPGHGWLLVNRAACLLYLGRLDEAAACLEGPLAKKETFPTAALYLGIVEFLRGNLGRAGEMARVAAEKTPKQVLAWYVGGLVAFEEGDLAGADQRFARALEVKESDGRALAGRAIAALEGGESGPEVEGWLEEARRLEPLAPIVILAGARWLQSRGDAEGGRLEAARALERLGELGMEGWVPYFEKLAHRWGLGVERATEGASELRQEIGPP